LSSAAPALSLGGWFHPVGG